MFGSSKAENFILDNKFQTSQVRKNLSGEQGGEHKKKASCVLTIEDWCFLDWSCHNKYVFELNILCKVTKKQNLFCQLLFAVLDVETLVGILYKATALEVVDGTIDH